MNSSLLLNKDMEALKIKFDGEGHQIDANTYINSLLHFTNLVQELNSELSSDNKVEIKINANAEGSFIVDLSLITSTLSSLFSAENVSYVANLVGVLGGVYALHSWLKGEKPKEIKNIDGKTQITNNNGNITVIDNRTYNIYSNNPTVRKALAAEFSTLDEDPNVKGFEILDKDNQPIVEVKREIFTALSTSDGFKSPTEQDIQKEGRLSIVTLSFEPKKKWEFIYEGNKISARMSDDFYEAIDKGEPFRKGDQLIAMLEIRQEFDEGVQTYLNKGYKISKIIKHIPRAEQGGLFDGKKA
ncbi:MAG: hypothetical protein U0T75_07835 [Chitinophagales bacterium]